jgi:hypothetical protein
VYLELYFLWAQSLLVELLVWRSDVTVHTVSRLQKVQLWSRARSYTFCTTYPSDIFIVVFSICRQIWTLWTNMLQRSSVIEDSVEIWHSAVSNQWGHKFSDIKTEAICSYETLVPIHVRQAWCHTSQVTRLHNAELPSALLPNCIVTLKILIYVLVTLLFSVIFHSYELDLKIIVHCIRVDNKYTTLLRMYKND